MNDELKSSTPRRRARAVRIGAITVGGDCPVVVQSMTNTDTVDVLRTAIQCAELARAGSELVRITVNTPEAAAAVPKITEHLAKMGPEKRDAIRSRLYELEKVKAIRIERLRGDGGRLEGCRWVLVAPERWARELPLSGLPRVQRIHRSVAPALVMPGLEKMPTKGLQEDGSPIKKAEHTQKNAVDNLRNLGLLLQNKEDYVNAERLFSELGGRLDLVRNAIALVRAHKKKNRPYLSSVSVEALKLLAEERYKNQIADSLAATARKMSSL